MFYLGKNDRHFTLWHVEAQTLKTLLDSRVFISNGAGRTVVRGASAYYYLIANDIGALEQASENFQRGKTELYKYSVSNDKVAFAVIDLANGHLKSYLDSQRGMEIYGEIEKAAPCIVKTTVRLVDATEITITPLSNPDQDFQATVVEMRRLAIGEKATLLNILRFFHDNFKLEPAIIGVGLRGNALLKRWIDALENSQPRDET